MTNVTKEEIIAARVELLCGMNNYVLERIGDEEIFEIWFMGGLPDGATMDDIIEIAKDDELWVSVVECFAECCRIDENNREIEKIHLTKNKFQIEYYMSTLLEYFLI